MINVTVADSSHSHAYDPIDIQKDLEEECEKEVEKEIEEIVFHFSQRSIGPVIIKLERVRLGFFFGSYTSPEISPDLRPPIA